MYTGIAELCYVQINSEIQIEVGLPGVWYLTGLSSFLVQLTVVDNFTENKTGESPAFLSSIHFNVT